MVQVCLFMNIESLCNVFLLIFSFMSGASHFCPMLCLHVGVVTLFALDFNNSGFGISAGSECYLVSTISCFLYIQSNFTFVTF